MTLDDDKFLALKIAIFNAIGFIAASLVTTYVDPMLTSHVKYGARTYKYGYWSLCLSVPIMIATFYFVAKYKNQILKCIFACIPLLLSGCISVIFVFQPEFPHANITTWVLSYCGISIITIWIRYAGDDLSYICDPKVSVTARVEALKTSINIWQTFTIAISVAYIAVLGVWFDKIWTNSGVIVTADKDKFIMSSTLVYEIILFSVYVVIGPIKESFSKTLSISSIFSVIGEPSSDNAEKKQ